MGWFGRDKKPHAESGGTPEEKARKFLSDYEFAEKMVNEYPSLSLRTSLHSRVTC
jgi:hypothetical protein